MYFAVKSCPIAASTLPLPLPCYQPGPESFRLEGAFDGLIKARKLAQLRAVSVKFRRNVAEVEQ